MTNDVIQHLLPICVSLLKKCILRSLTHYEISFLIELQVFIHTGKKSLVNYLIYTCFVASIDCLFTFLVVLFEAEKFLILSKPNFYILGLYIYIYILGLYIYIVGCSFSTISSRWLLILRSQKFIPVFPS